jgi:hypothetical protein
MSEEPLQFNDAPLHMGRLCHFIEQSEERILQSNATLAKLGAAGILTDQILLGPLIAYIGVKDVVRHLVSPTFIRSAICPHEGLGVVMFNADIVPLPRASEGWDLFPAHGDDRFIPFSRLPLIQKFVVVNRHQLHLHHLLAVMRCLIADQRIQPMQMENLMPKHEKPVSAYPAEEHALALEDLLKLLARLLAKRQLELNSSDPEEPKAAPDA